MSAGAFRDYRMPPAQKRAIVAKLLDHFHLSIKQLARLTDKQIFELYFHPRDDKGAIEPKDEPEQGAATEEKKPTLKSELMNLWKMAKALKLPPEQWTELEKQLRAKFAAQGETWDGTLPSPGQSAAIYGDPV